MNSKTKTKKEEDKSEDSQKEEFNIEENNIVEGETPPSNKSIKKKSNLKPATLSNHKQKVKMTTKPKNPTIKPKTSI